MGDISREEIVLSVDSPIVEHLKKRQQPLFQHDLEDTPAFEDLPEDERQWLQEMGMEIYVPISVQSIFLGVMAVGPPRSGEPFGQREQAFLTTLAHQTAVALQNARMFENMRELNLEIIQLNEDLRRANERLERLDQAKTDFLTIASHELRTPLTQVRGYADVLADLSAAQAITSDQIMAITDSIGMATDRLENIVRAMLDLSTIETDALELFLEQTTLKSVMEMALEPWMKPIRLRRLDLTVEGVEDVPPIVVDPQRLGQAFGNLISNAIKYTPDGGSIAIRARQTDEAHFEVVVADTGVGIDPTDHELVFDKFFRVGNSDQHSSSQFKFKGAGPGLGLSIVRGVVEAHGGRTWVVSEGCDEVRCPGSAFHVALPLQAYPFVVKGSEAAPSAVKGSEAASSNTESLRPDTQTEKVVPSDSASNA
jgi:signal transduction histidine kinase